MITFLSLFLGLVVGTHDVVVEPAAEVASVEILLDGRTVEILQSAPWSTRVDFGDLLRPHRLEAVALDAQGAELDRAVQWINLSRGHAEAHLSLDLDPSGVSSKVRVHWESTVEEEPRFARVQFDGAPLELADAKAFDLPPYNPKQLHFLQVELDFGDDLTAVAEATFGGFYADTVATELTPVVIQLGRDRKLELEDLAGRFRVRGEQADPVAVEVGEAEVLLVRDITTHRNLGRLFSTLQGRHRRYAPNGFFLRQYWTQPRAQQVGEKTYFLHPRSADLRIDSVDVLSTLLVSALEPTTSGSHYPAGAAAVAGMAALERDRRRAVVLIVGGPGTDASPFGPALIEDYLASVDVDLHVWTVSPSAWERWNGPAWSEARAIRLTWTFLDAVNDVIDGLKKQRVVWFAGRHLPQEIELIDPSPDLWRVGSERPARGRGR